MSATASTLYPHVHQFLVQAGLTKTAEKFVKEAKFAPGDERVERDLLEIYNLYLANEPKKATKRKHTETEVKVATEEAAPEPKKKDKKKSKTEAAPVAVPEPVAAEEPVVVEKKKKSKKSKEEQPVAAVEAEVVLPKKSNKAAVVSEEPSTTSDSSNGSSSDTNEASTPVANGNGKKKGSKKATPAPFQRIAPTEKLDILPDHEFDPNAVGCGTAWGARANEKLSVTRGKGFRHEKTKAKRGTYRGGELETGVRSIKFD